MKESDIKNYTFRIILNNYCNYKCNLCFNEWQGHDARHNNISLDSLKSALEPYINEIDYLKLTGGEPLLNPNIKTITDYLTSLSLVSITTNGSLLKKWYNKLSDKILYTISIYGYDSNSFISYTNKTADDFVNFQNQLSVVKMEPERFSANVLIQPNNNWNFEKFLNFCIEKGFKKIRFITLISNNNNLVFSDNRKEVESFFETNSKYAVPNINPTVRKLSIKNVSLELVTQYSEFSSEVNSNYGFYWVNIDGSIRKAPQFDNILF
ncbi:radical SAM protein [Sunxiuqinia elliptica]|uniref:4Fe-4S single cluster domain-containing protein n=1 Tax=Sunxiuqinia elliptica TaxID=655355 RepID=A0A1I2MIB8_9BACT|nr:radical SAM protein [Sunxiuqinia elliptica]SFF90479.1 4Fe-4S single cluster domain-containing protein [Sunxiuqinia elliptica]